MTLGAYAIYIFNRMGLSLPLAAIIGSVIFGLFVIACNWVLFKPFVRNRAKPITLLIVTVALSFIIQNVVLLIWGGDTRRYSVTFTAVRHVGPFLWTATDIGVMAGAVVLLAGLHVFLRYTPLGRMVRATANNAELAEVSGINVERVTTWTWMASGALAALAGAALVLEVNQLSPTVGFTELFLVFAAIILGGIGRVYGAMVGAVLIGLISELAAMYLGGAYNSVLAFAAVVLLLVFRPQGLFKASTSVV
jgi:branched-subunit amino acid ABC-type transport system permease component